MTTRFRFWILSALLAAGLATIAAQAAQVQLKVIRFPERKSVEVPMQPSRGIPEAAMKAKMQFQEGQMRIEVSYQRMKPAVLFAGDVTCYVLWAINRDGGSENLGELWVRPEHPNDKIRFQTGLRTFALLVTAEAHSQVERPSELIIFQSGPSPEPQAPDSPLTFSGLDAAPKHGLETLSNVRYDGKTPLDVLQAEKVFQMAQRIGATKHAPAIYNEANVSLKQSQVMARSGRAKRGAQEFARKSVASSTEAIKISMRRIEADRLEEQIAARQAEIAELEARADRAEEETKRLAQESQRRVDSLQQQKAQLEQQKTRLEGQKAEAENAIRRSQDQLERLMERQRATQVEKRQLDEALERTRQQQLQLQESMRQMEASMAGLREEKSRLESRLSNALSQVADTQESARGYIVNLPDILFDVNQATLKPEARQVIAKLVGILLIMQDLNLRVEGHTDSTGSEAYNMKLSQERAASVFDFLAQEGIASTRMKAQGYGLDRPLADNSSAEGRSKNRRVEIIISEGDVRESEGGR